jgi:Rad3-related DNA helicase
MAGRVTRTPDDEGITIIADSSFKTLYNKARASFPDWFSEALKWESQW